ncbi:MAG: hypothetical protein JXQ73_29520 [Phycisphaerae bacterium]|nr:hypothetical protein [Phycisphaerae bacterium]
MPLPPQKRPRWWLAALLAFLMLAVLDWLLARLVWLPLYFGLFFFLIAGLLVGAVSFRIARVARPVPKHRIVTGILLLALASSLVTVIWEYRNVADTAGGDRKFPDARNSAIAAGRPTAEVEAEATRLFKDALHANYPPGGPIGYIRWATTSGEMALTVRGCSDTVSIDHGGIAWPVRSAAAMVLLAVGLWLSFESLRSPVPVSNVFAQGEEAEEEEDD